VSAAERLLARLLGQAHAEATTYAVRRLLERRPDLTPPADLPVLVSRDEDAAYTLDRLTFMAWLARQIAAAVEVDVSTALHAGATWAQLAAPLHLTAAEARERYAHLSRVRTPRRVRDDRRHH
jgi:hypothetical protein